MACAYSHQGRGPSADLRGRIHISDFRNSGKFSLAFRSRFIHPGPESMEVELFAWDELPWDELPWDALAFPSVAWALKHMRMVRDGTHLMPFTSPAD